MHNVQTSLLPFNLQHKITQVPEGLTLHEMVKTVFPRRIKGLKVAVSINGDLIPNQNWHLVRPKKDTLICINIVPTGGRRKKNPLATILSIAVAVVAPYAAAAWGASLGLAVTGTGVLTVAQTALYTGIVRIGIGMVGYLATSMLSSTPRQSYSGGSQSITESRTQFIEGASNVIDKFGVIPVNLGTNRMFPKQAALPYSELSAESQYARQLFTYGYGKHIITERKFGETLVSSYQEVEMEDRLNTDLHLGTKLYSNDVFQEGLSVTLSSDNPASVFTTQNDSNEFELDFTFPRGIWAFANDQNKKVNELVSLEIQFAPTGTTDWSTGSLGESYALQSLTLPLALSTESRKGFILLSLDTGIVTAHGNVDEINVPEGSIRIASYEWNEALTAISLIDERASHIPEKIVDSSDFTMTITSVNTLNVSAGDVQPVKFDIIAAKSSAIIKSYRRRFPIKGQYDIRIKKLSPDSTVDTRQDTTNLVALKSIKDNQPVNQTDISGTALRIRATDQLNGAVQQYNAIVSTIVKYYDSVDDIWVDGISSNPAALFRYVLQSNAFIRKLPDAGLDIEKLEEWSIFCDANNLTYNKVIDSDASVDDVLNDICAAGMATKHSVSGIYSVIIDNERPMIKGLVTPRNSWSYKGNINYPQLPHALRVQFRNKDKGYALDERIVYADGYNESTAIEFERVEFLSCTNAELAYFYGRRYLATALLQPETHTFNVDFENLTFDRGDRISFVHDSILVGVGQGRIKSLITSGSDVTGFVLDDEVEIPSTDTFAVRIRHADASGFTYHLLTTTIGVTDTFTFATPVPTSTAPTVDSLCAFVEDGKELDLIVTEIKTRNDRSATITAVNYAPARFNPLGVIPPFTSNVTIPLGFYKPLAPQLQSEVQSDESVMLRNSDGSYTSRMLIPLNNLNESNVGVLVRSKPVGSTVWDIPNILSLSPDLVVLTGLTDGVRYDIEIRYRRSTGQQFVSDPLVLSDILYVGASTLPDDVTGFKLSSVNETGIFEWNPSQNIDISHYVVKFSRLTTGATWGGSQVIADNVTGNRVIAPVQSGTYTIKAVDILGNESLNPAVIISEGEGIVRNVVELLQEQTTFTGTKVNCSVVSGKLVLTDPAIQGVYNFSSTIDLGDVYTSFLSSSIIASGVDLTPSNLIRSIANVRTVDFIRGTTDPTKWNVVLQMRLSQDGTTYTAWTDFVVGNQTFRSIQFRLLINSLDLNVGVEILTLEVVIDMPDRQERGAELSCPTGGITIIYPVAFKNNPAVNITLKNGATDDRIDFSAKSSSGFTFRVYNATLATYVTRTFDYTASGYGRVI